MKWYIVICNEPDLTTVPHFKAVVTCKIKHLQKFFVLVFYFTRNHRKTFAKHLQKCFRDGYM